MVTLTVFQLLALVGAGSLLALASLGWAVAAVSSRYNDTAIGYVGRLFGCAGRAVALLSTAGMLTLILVAVVL